MATFFSAFILAALSLHLVGSSRPTRESLSPPPPGRADVHAAVVGTIDWHRADTPVPAIFDLRFSSDLSAIAAIPARLTEPTDNIKPGPAPAPELTLPRRPDIAVLANPAEADIAAPPEAPPLGAIAPPDVIASLIAREPDLDLAALAPPAAAPTAAPPPKPRVKQVRRATKTATPAAPTSFFDLFGVGAR